MYDDYEIDYSLSNEYYAYDLDEMCEHYMQSSCETQNDSYDHDDDYARDTQDYDALAYRHYA